MKITVNEQGALYIALGETMLNKNVTLEEAQKQDQRDYVVSRLQHYGVQTVERAEEIAKGGLKGLKIDPDSVDDPAAITNGSTLADSGIPATSNNGEIINNAPGVKAGEPVPAAQVNPEATDVNEAGTTETAGDRTNAQSDAKKDDPKPAVKK